MSEPDDPVTKSGGGADRIEAMLADFRTAPVAPPVSAPEPASAPAPAAPRRPRDDAVRPLWQAEGGRAAAPKSPWWQARPVWALVGLLVGIAGSQGWQALRQQEQRNQALASVTLPGEVMPSVAADVQGPAPAPAPITEARQAPVLAAAQPAAAAALTEQVAPAAPVPPAALPAAPPPPVVTAAPRAPVAAPAAKRPAKTDSPSARCKQRKGAEFQRCLQVQCRKDRYFAHRQCIALYERNAKP